MEAKFCLFIFYLCFQHVLETKSASINETDVAKYLIQRNLKDRFDVFNVLFKQACESGGCKSCSDVSGDDFGIPENFSIRCACKYDSRTFLPEKGKCLSDQEVGETLKGKQTLLEIGCSQYQYSWDELFLNGFDLENNGTFKDYIQDKFRSCKVIHGSSMYYDSLKGKWKQICSEIFSVKFDKDDGIILEWKADTNKELSGRIIRLIVTCVNTSGSILEGCLLVKAVGDVTYNYVNQSTVQESGCPFSTMSSLGPTQSSLLPLPAVTSSFLSSQSFSPSPLSFPSSSSLSLPVSRSKPLPLLSSFLPPTPSPLPRPSSSSTVYAATTVLESVETVTASLASSSFFPGQSQTSQIPDQSKTSSSKIIAPSNPETRNPVPSSTTESFINTVVSKTLHKPAMSTNIFSVHPSKSSLATRAASGSAAIDGPGNKKARTSGNENGVVIGAAVGGAVVFGIFVVVIIVFCKRRKMWKNQQKAAKLEVKNPVYGSSDIPLSAPTENKEMAASEQDSQPTYQGLIINNGQMNGSALYSNPEDNYDNYTVYQSLDMKIPETPVYQSLKKGQVATGKPNPKPKPGATGQPSARPIVMAEPVHNVLEQPDAEQGTMPEKDYGDPEHDDHGDKQDPLYNVLDGPDAEQGTMPEKDYWDPEHDDHGETQDPLYNVLDGPDAEQNYEAPDVGDPLYNVLEGPESKQGPQEPLYNVLESTEDPYDASNSEPLYNVLEGPESDGPNKGGAGYAAPNGSTSPGAHDNPAYEQTLELDAPYASVHKPGSQRESVYEPLRGSGTQDLYERISKRGT